MIAEPRRALLVSPTDNAQDAAAKLRERRDWVDLDQADMVVALGGDGFMLHTLHEMLDGDRASVPVFGTITYPVWRTYGWNLENTGSNSYQRPAVAGADISATDG